MSSSRSSSHGHRPRGQSAIVADARAHGLGCTPGGSLKACLLVCTVLTAGCAAYQPPTPPTPPTPHEATEVAASLGKTWDAVIDMFAARNIPIRTIERVSGIIATERLSVGDEGKGWADCGQDNGTTLSPNFAIYNVLVRGDSESSRVQATVRWTLAASASSAIECSTSHVWERELEAAAKGRAESPPHGAPDEAPSSAPATRSTETAFAGSADASSDGASSDGAMTPSSAATTFGPAAPAPARGLRSGVELLGEATFATAVSDLQSLNALQGFGETGTDTLTVQLTDQGIRALAIRHYLRRLFYAYRYANQLRADTILLLTHGGRVVGTYSETGLDKVNWR